MNNWKFSRFVKKSAKLLAAISLLVCMVTIYLKYETNPVWEVSKLIQINIPGDSEVVEWFDLRDGFPRKGEVYYSFQIKEDQLPAFVSQTEGWTTTLPTVRNPFHQFNVPPIHDGRYYTNIMQSNIRDSVWAAFDVKARRLYVLRVARGRPAYF